MTSKFKIRRLAAAAGAEICGLNLNEPLDSETIEQVQQALGQHCVLLFKDADLSPQQHVSFSRQFGALETHVMTDVFGLKEHPEILVVSNVKEGNKHKGAVHAGQYWHSDVSFMEKPSVGSLLLCHEMPDLGGDTMFANMYLAYDSLSESLKKMLGELKAIHDYNHVYDTYFSKVEGRPSLTPEQRAKAPPREHPAVRTHPVTGRKALYVNPGFTTGFVGMLPEESQPLLEFLFRHSTKPEFIYRHRWNVHDLIFWDNRCTMHYALNDYDNSVRRHMHRTTIAGDQPY